METRHVRLDYDEALGSKKELLNMQLNLLRASKKMKAYGVLRKKELALKNKLKVDLINVRTKVQLFLSTLPDEHLKKKNKTKKVNLKNNERDFQRELEDIKNKLEKLG